MRNSFQLLGQIGIAVAVMIVSIAALIAGRVIPIHRRVVSNRDQLLSARTGEERSSQIRRVFLGFAIAVMAAVSWGIGNVLTQYSAEKYGVSHSSSPIVEIALANYIGGSTTIICVSLLIHVVNRKRHAASALSPSGLGPRLMMPAIFKGLNTYTFTGAVAVITAGAAATVENLHVLWTAILVSIFRRRLISRGWFVSVAVIVIGTVLTLGLGTRSWVGVNKWVGLSLALAAGITFALFVVRWNKVGGGGASYLPQRGLETGIFLCFSALVILSIYYVVGKGILGGGWSPFGSISVSDLWLQIFNGTFNIGLTYFLMSESLRVASGAGPIAAVLLSLGVSYAVLFSVLAQYIILDVHVSGIQWVGIAIFSIGFATIRQNVGQAVETEMGDSKERLIVKDC